MRKGEERGDAVINSAHLGSTSVRVKGRIGRESRLAGGRERDLTSGHNRSESHSSAGALPSASQ